jgi:hypothetical protein
MLSWKRKRTFNAMRLSFSDPKLQNPKLQKMVRLKVRPDATRRVGGHS